MELVNKFNETRDMNPLYYLYRGNKFSFPTNKLIENQKRISGTKRDMRRKFIKSDRPTYNQNRIVNRAEEGMKFAEFKPVDIPGLQETFTAPEMVDILLSAKPNPDLEYLKQFSSIEDILGIPQEDETLDVVSNLGNSFITVPVNNHKSYGFDVDAAVNYLTKHANNGSVKQCAKYVRKALEAGGLNTEGHPTSAADYISYMPKLGFDLVINGEGNNLPEDYTPQKGDVMVIGRVGKHKHGHIAMYNGQQWISDFKQKSYQIYNNMDKYTIWRHK